MCGLVGIAGAPSHKNKDLLNDMLVFSSVRGFDSTGVAMIEESGTKSHIVKAVGNPYDLFNYKPYDSLSTYNKTAMIGHCRKATVGGISRYTAHPFESSNGRVVGVHNGTLNGWRADFNRLRPKFADDFETDSQCLIEAIGEFGVEAALEYADGAYAVVYYDKQEKTLNFFRNDKRTLWYAWSEDRKTMLWASEHEMIHLAANRNGIKLFVENGYRFWAFPEQTLVTISLDNKQAALVGKKDLPEYKRTTTYYGNNNPYRAGYGNNSGGGAAQSNVQSPFLPLQKEKEEILDDDFPFPALAAVVHKETLPATTNLVDESESTKGHGHGQTTEKDSHHHKPLLSCVANSKKSGSEKSTTKPVKKSTPTKGSTDSPCIESYNGLEINEEQYNLSTYTACIFCDKDVNFEEAQEGGIGRWLSYDSFLCKSCHEGETGPSLPYSVAC